MDKPESPDLPLKHMHLDDNIATPTESSFEHHIDVIEPEGSSAGQAASSIFSGTNLLVSGGNYNQTNAGQQIIYNLHFPPHASDAQVQLRTVSDHSTSQTDAQGPHMRHSTLAPPNTADPPQPIAERTNFYSGQTSIKTTPEPDTSIKIYERNMLKKRRGYPLWVPECSQSLPIEKRRLGVAVGDVGLIDEEGGFVFLFNILLPPDHPFHPREMPEGYTPVAPLQPHDLMITYPLRPNTALTSVSVRRLEPPATSSSTMDLNFEIFSSEGAVLAVPDGARCIRIQRVRLWEDYMTAHIKSWYIYVRAILGFEANNGDIRLVIGCDMASSWAMAVAEQQPIFPQTWKLRLRPAIDEGCTVKHVWECNGIIETRVGPSQEEIDDVLPDTEGSTSLLPIRNQCLFVRCANSRLSDDEWENINREGEMIHNGGTWHASGELSTSLSHSESKGKGPASYPQGSASNSKAKFVNYTQVVQSPYTGHHPADGLSKLLLFLYPQAQLAIINDDELFFALGNLPDSNGPPNENEMMCALLLERCFDLNDGDIKVVQSRPPIVHAEEPERHRLVTNIVHSMVSFEHTDSEENPFPMEDLFYTLHRVTYLLDMAETFRNSENSSLDPSCNGFNFDPLCSSTITDILWKLALILKRHDQLERVFAAYWTQFQLSCENSSQSALAEISEGLKLCQGVIVSMALSKSINNHRFTSPQAPRPPANRGQIFVGRDGILQSFPAEHWVITGQRKSHPQPSTLVLGSAELQATDPQSSATLANPTHWQAEQHHKAPKMDAVNPPSQFVVAPTNPAWPKQHRGRRKLQILPLSGPKLFRQNKSSWPSPKNSNKTTPPSSETPEEAPLSAV